MGACKTKKSRGGGGGNSSREAIFVKSWWRMVTHYSSLTTRIFIRNLAQSLVLTAPYFWASFYHIVVLKFNCTFSALNIVFSVKC